MGAKRRNFIKKEYVEMMESVCIELNYSLITNSKFDTKLSGSTGVLALIDRNKVVVANVGDSRCVILHQNPKVFEKGRKFNMDKIQSFNCLKFYQIRELTKDQTPEDIREKERILRSGGIVRPSMRKAATLTRSVPTGEFIGPPRIWRPSLDCPGLMMSRSFGDKIAHQYGVICIPGKFCA